MNYWSKKDTNIYKGMTQRHHEFWRFVARFIKEKNIQSILEIGCGFNSPIKNIAKYTAIDINEQVDAIHEDFTKMDISPYKGYDLLVASAVIEHCEGYSDFLEQVKKAEPKHAIITFFNRLDRDRDLYMTTTKDPIGTFPWNRYSKVGVENKLKELGFQYEIIRIMKDDVLII